MNHNFPGYIVLAECCSNISTISFTLTSTKSNDPALQKGINTLFLVIFTQSELCTMLSFRKILWSNSKKTFGQIEGWTDRTYESIPRKHSDGRTDREKDGWTDGRSKFIGSFQPRLGTQKVMHKNFPPFPTPMLNTVDSSSGALC